MVVHGPALPAPALVIAFWRAAGPPRWFRRDLAFDRLCRMRFIAAHEAARAGALDQWASDPEGALALVILLDQLSRNMFRGTPRVYAADAQALALARAAVAEGFDRRIPRPMRQIFYLPFMHAEDRAAQAHALRLYEAYADPVPLSFARHHTAIVERFGRFPHRNGILGRETTVEEAAFLETDPFRG